MTLLIYPTSVRPVTTQCPIPIRDARTILLFAGSYEQVAELLRLRPHMTPRGWLRAVAHAWAGIDGRRDALVDALVANYEGWAPMLSDCGGRKLASSLPVVLTVWRACYESVNERGVSYSRSEAVARSFFSLHRYSIEGYRQRLIEITVVRDLCGFVEERQELEVIVPPGAALTAREVDL